MALLQGYSLSLRAYIRRKHQLFKAERSENDQKAARQKESEEWFTGQDVDRYQLVSRFAHPH